VEEAEVEEEEEEDDDFGGGGARGEAPTSLLAPRASAAHDDAMLDGLFFGEPLIVDAPPRLRIWAASRR
jgi:hypothetical protein